MLLPIAAAAEPAPVVNATGEAGGAIAPSSLTLEQRLARIERILQNQSLSGIVLQLQQLQREVQQLRGELELQSHAMDAMERRARDRYIDIDQRLTRLQGGAAGTPAAAPAAPEPGLSPSPPVTPSTPPTTATSPAAPVDRALEETEYQAAFDLLKQGRYGESVGAFRTFLERFPGGSYADNAQYWLAEASYVTRDFDTALAEFGKVVNGFPSSPKVPGALLKSGYIHHEQQRWAEARAALERLLRDYPGSTEARLAEKRLERISAEGH